MIEPSNERRNPLWLNVSITQAEARSPQYELCEKCFRDKNMCVVRGFLRRSNIGHFYIAKCTYQLPIE